MKTTPAALLVLVPVLLAMVAGCAAGQGVPGADALGGGATTRSSGGSGSGGGAPGTGSTSSGASTSSTSPSSTSGASSSGSTVAAPMAVGCVTDVSAGHHVFSCDGGITYDVEISPACAAGGCGLVLDVHGYTMNAAQEDLATGMRALGDQQGYVVVQPNAPGVPASWVQATQAPLVFAFVSDLAKAMVTDPRRAHVMGFSEGGGMTWAMVCAHADFFASASPLAGIPGCAWVAPNAPSRPVPTLQVTGTEDLIVDYTAVAVPMRDVALAFWGDGPGTVLSTSSGYTATRYVTSAGVPYEFWAHDYAAGNATLGGHCAPGGSDMGPALTQFGCEGAGQFVYGQIALAFFVANPMP
jgi:polyhydroxybutyrate depolymerase